MSFKQIHAAIEKGFVRNPGWEGLKSVYVVYAYNGGKYACLPNAYPM